MQFLTNKVSTNEVLCPIYIVYMWKRNVSNIPSLVLQVHIGLLRRR